MPSFVCPIPGYLRGHLLKFNRLYAYPVRPEPPAPGGFIILDSGAFALSLQRKRMDEAYLKCLALHYRKYLCDRAIAIAPDVCRNPKQTIKNWELWQSKQYPPVAPVLQSTRVGFMDTYSMLDQARYYARHEPDFLFISNPKMRCASHEPPQLIRFVERVREITKATHVHLFGAGWDRADLREYGKLGIFDSLDSTSYYSAKERFRDNIMTDDRVNRAVDNAIFANQLMQ